MKPIITKEDVGSAHEHERHVHPAFGVITVGRVTSSKGMHLFGSALPHRDLIEIEISTATGRRNYHDTDSFIESPVVSVYMSASQWAQFVSSAGIGGGTPVTIQYMRGGDLVEPPDIDPHEALHQTFSREVEEACREYIAKAEGLLEKVEAMMADKTVKKSDLAAVRARVRELAQNMPSNMAFMQTQFYSTVERTVAEGKAAIEAHAMNVQMRTGVAGNAGHLRWLDHEQRDSVVKRIPRARKQS